MVLYLAGLQGVPTQLYEAAAIDGAGRWRRFWHVTLPLLRPTLLFVLVTQTIGVFQVFVVVLGQAVGRRERQVVGGKSVG